MELLCQGGAFVVGLAVALLAVRLVIEGLFALTFGPPPRGWPPAGPAPRLQEDGRSTTPEIAAAGATGGGMRAGVTSGSDVGFARWAR